MDDKARHTVPDDPGTGETFEVKPDRLPGFLSGKTEQREDEFSKQPTKSKKTTKKKE